MGGNNQGCSAPVPSIPASQKIRFHEEPNKSEAHFHDDTAGLKCAVDYALFMKRYSQWRNDGCDGEEIFLGHDGAKGISQVKFVAFPNDQGELDVAITVSRINKGKDNLPLSPVLTDLDRMADYS